MNGGVTGREPLLLPAARLVDGKVECKHVRVYGGTNMRVEGGSTRVPFDKRDFVASNSNGAYLIEKVKQEVLFWLLRGGVQACARPQRTARSWGVHAYGASAQHGMQVPRLHTQACRRLHAGPV